MKAMFLRIGIDKGTDGTLAPIFEDGSFEFIPISEYDENLINVGTEIKTMEKVFSKVLPSLTDSVNKLQRFSDSYGSVKKK